MEKEFDLRNSVEQYYDIQQNRKQAVGRIVSYVTHNMGWEEVARLQLIGELNSVVEDEYRNLAKTDPNKALEMASKLPRDKKEKFRVLRSIVEQRYDIDKVIGEDYKTTISNAEQKYGLKIPPLTKPFAWYAQLIVDGVIQHEEIENMVWTANRLLSTEKDLENRIALVVRDFSLYTDYLKHIKGIGEILAGGLIGWLSPISNFKYPSRLRAYAGFSAQHYKMKCDGHGDSQKQHKVIATSPKEHCPVRVKKGGKMTTCGARVTENVLYNSPPKRVAGYYTMFNQKLKDHLWLIAKSFEYAKPGTSFYRYIYDNVKAYYTARDGEKKSAGHIRTMTLIYTGSMFASHLWEVWRKMEGLPVSEPYSIEKLGHKRIIPMADKKNPVVPVFSTELHGDLEVKVGEL